MAKGIVFYYSRSGNTKEMAEIIAEAMNEADLPTECKPVNKVKAEDLLGYDAIGRPEGRPLWASVHWQAR